MQTQQCKIDCVTLNAKMNTRYNVPKKTTNKEFKIRDAPLTTTFEGSEDGKTIYNVFITMFVSMSTYTVFDQYTKTGKSHFGFRLINLGFNKLHLVILVWCASNLLACLNYSCFIYWARVRTTLKPRSQQLWDKLWVTLLIIYYFVFLYGLQIVGNNVHFAQISATIIFMEQLRLLMKQHAFIRTNVPRVLLFKIHSDDILQLPNFGKFVYFMFAPTMIYRDEYPRTQCIRWKFVLSNVAQLLGTMWFLSLMIERFLVPTFHDMCIRKFTLGEIMTPILTNFFSGFLFLLGLFYTLLHTSQNVFAEMLRFGDRMFHKQWWQSKSLSEFYRTWNVLVHDWLYTYIYRDFYEVVIPGNKLAAKFAVFFVSAVVHEWLFTNIFRFFFPINFILFFITGAVFTLINILDSHWGNLLVLYGIALGCGIEVNLYTLEIYARYNCPLNENVTDVGFYVPRFIACECIALKSK